MLGDDTCFGDDEDNPTLKGFLQRVHDALSVRFRPVFIHFDAKTDAWGDPPFFDNDAATKERTKEAARLVAFGVLQDPIPHGPETRRQGNMDEVAFFRQVNLRKRMY